MAEEFSLADDDNCGDEGRRIFLRFLNGLDDLPVSFRWLFTEEFTLDGFCEEDRCIFLRFLNGLDEFSVILLLVFSDKLFFFVYLA